MVSISGIKPSQIQQLVQGNEQQGDGSVFKDFFDSAVNLLNDTNTLEINADDMAVDFAAGKIDNVQDVMIAQEKANIALQFTVNLRNQLLTAYNEIMRIQM